MYDFKDIGRIEAIKLILSIRQSRDENGIDMCTKKQRMLEDEIIKGYKNMYYISEELLNRYIKHISRNDIAEYILDYINCYANDGTSYGSMLWAISQSVAPIKYNTKTGDDIIVDMYTVEKMRNNETFKKAFNTYKRIIKIKFGYCLEFDID